MKLITPQHLLQLERSLNVFVVLAIICLSCIMLIVQFSFQRLPCSFCLLLRIGYLAIAFGFLLNLRFGLRPRHYTLILLSALFTAFVSLRQIIVQAEIDQSAISQFLNLRWMTWSFVMAILLVLVACIFLGLERQYEHVSEISYWKTITYSLFSFLALIIFVNMVAAFLQCGFSACPDIPTGYRLLQ